MRTALIALAASAVLFASGAGLADGREQGCWHRPQPQTVEEIGAAIANQERRAAARSRADAPREPATLALSNPSGALKAAYGAGLLVGWGETGNRPEFSVVTAVGVSALVAPFAFIGTAGDRRIADLFACEATSLQGMAERAAAYIDAETLERIARRHDRGGRLLVAAPGSAARYEVVWDIGAIAASRHPKAHTYIRSILLAAVDLTTVVDPATVPIKAGIVVERNSTFRQLGAGEPFLANPGAGWSQAATYLIHHGVLFPDEGGAYITARRKADGEATPRASMPIVTAYDVLLAAEARGTGIFIASPRPGMNIQPASEFDMPYLRALFLDAYRQGRMSREWRRTFQDRDASRRYQ
jgi:hypothetical protein